MPANDNRLIMDIGLQAGHDALQFLYDLRVMQNAGPGFSNDRKIHSSIHLPKVAAKIFPQPPFKTIAAHGVSDLATDRKTQPQVPYLVVASDGRKMRRVVPLTLSPDLLILSCATQTAGRRKGVAPLHPIGCTLLARNRYREALAAFGPTSFNDVDTVVVTHPLAKTVGALATNFTRLICAFHDFITPEC